MAEQNPWIAGKRPLTTAMMGLLARWTLRLNWQETAEVSHSHREAVYRSVQWFVAWGLAHRRLSGVEAVGIDEIHWGRGMRADSFLTVVYQVDAGCRRLLLIGKRGCERTLRRELNELGKDFVQGLRYVCSDMWKPYLKLLAKEAGQALNLLDRFHITQHLNRAVDEAGWAESSQPRAHSQQEAQELKHMRWPLLRKDSQVRGKARRRLKALLANKLDMARAWDLKEAFSQFWKYKSVLYSAALDAELHNLKRYPAR